MAMILTDTCVLIEYLKEYPEVKKEFNGIGFENIMLNSIIVMEVIVGARNKVELNSIKKRLNKFHVLEINQSVMDDAGSLLETYCLSHGLKIPDAVIAATARYYDIPLYTFNQKDFRYIPNIKLYKY
jgi:tRNA(fMet)-specific endonuclease VapC